MPRPPHHPCPYRDVLLVHKRQICRCDHTGPRISVIISIYCKLFQWKIFYSGLFFQFPSCCILQIFPHFGKPAGQRQNPMLG